MDLSRGTYKGFPGGLYPGSSNQTPAEHAAAGLERARRIGPVDAQGQPNPTGKTVLLSIGMSNTSQEFCGRNVTSGCWSGSFMDQAAADASVNHSTLVIINGAQGGRDAQSWTKAGNNVYDVVRDERLRQLGVTERQVQVVWLKQANAGPKASLPDTSADAYQLERSLGEIVRALRVRYPNLQQVFVSSRTYAGYATTQLNPEPYAYESGFAVKWLVQAQIDQTTNSGRVVDARAGDLNYNSVAPWIAWGAVSMGRRHDCSLGRLNVGTCGFRERRHTPVGGVGCEEGGDTAPQLLQDLPPYPLLVPRWAELRLRWRS